jgi:DNA-binding response OmpR family regulator
VPVVATRRKLNIPIPRGLARGGTRHAHRLKSSSPQSVERKTADDLAARRRVLVVDDEPSMRLLCRVNLNLGGFDVVEASDGATGLAEAQRSEFAIVLLDLMMPDMSGHEVVRRLREDALTRDVAVVFLSARGTRADLLAGFELGALDYITKPFDPIELVARLEQVLARIESGEAERFRQARLNELSG